MSVRPTVYVPLQVHSTLNFTCGFGEGRPLLVGEKPILPYRLNMPQVFPRKPEEPSRYFLLAREVYANNKRIGNVLVDNRGHMVVLTSTQHAYYHTKVLDKALDAFPHMSTLNNIFQTNTSSDSFAFFFILLAQEMQNLNTVFQIMYKHLRNEDIEINYLRNVIPWLNSWIAKYPVTQYKDTLATDKFYTPLERKLNLPFPVYVLLQSLGALNQDEEKEEVSMRTEIIDKEEVVNENIYDEDDKDDCFATDTDEDETLVTEEQLDLEENRYLQTQRCIVPSDVTVRELRVCLK
jgi:hypothetical protein